MRKWRRLAETCGLGSVTICVVVTCLGAMGAGVGAGVVVAGVVAGGCTMGTARGLESAGGLSPPPLWPTTWQRIWCPGSSPDSVYIAAVWPAMATPWRLQAKLKLRAPVPRPGAHVPPSPGGPVAGIDGAPARDGGATLASCGTPSAATWALSSAPFTSPP